MSAQHTAGDWFFQPRRLYGFEVRARITPSFDAHVVDVPTESDARLIAAAPELLEALERIACPHDCGCVPCTGQCRSQMALEIAVEEMQGLARAAIAKAKGEQA